MDVQLKSLRLKYRRKSIADEIRRIKDEMERIVKLGNDRLKKASRDARDRHPTPSDWLSTEESHKLDDLGRKLGTLEFQHLGRAEDRTQLKRELRRRGIAFSNEASIEELRKLAGKSMRTKSAADDLRAFYAIYQRHKEAVKKEVRTTAAERALLAKWGETRLNDAIEREAKKRAIDEQKKA